ncbi:MAG: hypothetical protein WB902_07965, partial [Acetobacteraceae bacterium]
MDTTLKMRPLPSWFANQVRILSGMRAVFWRMLLRNGGSYLNTSAETGWRAIFSMKCLSAPDCMPSYGFIRASCAAGPFTEHACEWSGMDGDPQGFAAIAARRHCGSHILGGSYDRTILARAPGRVARRC